MAKKQTDKPFCAGTMTKAQFFSWIRSALRRLSVRWLPKNKALNAVRVAYTGADKRTKWVYKCQDCAKLFKRKDIECDHIVACGSLLDYGDLAGFVKRLFCEQDGYRILCTQCHLKITNESRNA